MFRILAIHHPCFVFLPYPAQTTVLHPQSRPLRRYHRTPVLIRQSDHHHDLRHRRLGCV